MFSSTVKVYLVFLPTSKTKTFILIENYRLNYLHGTFLPPFTLRTLSVEHFKNKIKRKITQVKNYQFFLQEKRGNIYLYCKAGLCGNVFNNYLCWIFIVFYHCLLLLIKSSFFVIISNTFYVIENIQKLITSSLKHM